MVGLLERNLIYLDLFRFIAGIILVLRPTWCMELATSWYDQLAHFMRCKAFDTLADATDKLAQVTKDGLVNPKAVIVVVVLIGAIFKPTFGPLPTGLEPRVSSSGLLSCSPSS